MQKKWTPADLPDQSGKVIIITGANSGLGFASAKVLAQAGATIIMACRDEERGAHALREIKRAVPDGDLELIPLDLASLDSIAAFAKKFSANYERLDVLLNNAGIMATPFGKTKDGFEQQFGVNHLGHFALTARLLPLLRATPQSRVVAVSSLAAHSGTINFEDLHGEKNYQPWKAYRQSKLANLMFALELNRRFQAAGANAISVATHPGGAATNLGRHVQSGKVARFLAENIFLPLLPGPFKGARAQLYAAGAEQVPGGTYFGLDGPGQIWGYPKKIGIPAPARREKEWKKLWEVSEKLTGLSFNL